MTGRVISMAGRRAEQRRRELAREAAARAKVMLLVLVATLLVVGLGATLSASSVMALRETGDSLYFFKRQLLWTAVGSLALLAASRIRYQVYRRLALPVFLLAVLGLVAVLLVGEVRGGSRRWIVAGPFQFQPSEFAKFATVIFLASVMEKKERLLKHFGHFFAPVLVSVGVVGTLVMMQPDLGTTLIIAAGAFAVLTTSAAPLLYVVTAGLSAGIAAFLLAASSPYRRARVVSFLDPFRDPLGDGFQAVQSLLALGSGGLFGVGLGASRARWSFLPNAHTDFIFAIIGEETGLAGAAIVVLLLAALGVVGTVVAFRAPDRFGRLLGMGIVTWLSVQALVNIGGVVAVLPITGVPLPFVSFGGSALVTSMAAVGVLLNIAGQGRPGQG
ncbi:MAG: putative lipid II flippase FtsW [Actinomycetota bacterium]|nr:putative lipid II flippase FtsW [Actinomycetota bacterium]